MNSHLQQTSPRHDALVRAAKWLAAAAGISIAVSSFSPIHAADTGALTNVMLVESGTDDAGKVNLTVNKTSVVTTKKPYARMNIATPDVADVTTVGPTTLLITAKKPGNTQLIVWDDQEKSQTIEISVVPDLQALRDQLKKTFPDYNVTVTQLADGIALQGHVPNLQVAEQMTASATPFGKVLNLLEVSGGQQIMLKVQFVEMSRLASTELGFRGAVGGNGFAFGTNNGPGAGTYLGVASGNPDVAISDAVSLFGAGKIGDIALEGFLHALKTNNLARTLAEPNLVAISGEPASFLAGGEIPIPVPQAGAGGASTITIQYKEFGVRLNYTAIVLGDGRVRLKVTQEVSDVDYSRAVSFAGGNVPAFSTRRADSTVELFEGQTLALAGLLQRKVSSSSTKTPLLGDLPIVGGMFRSVRYERQETELVILVKPVLVSAMNPDQIPALPGGKWRYPTEAQLYGNADLGGPNGSPGNPPATEPAPRFIGQNGFGEDPVDCALPVEQASVSAD